MIGDSHKKSDMTVAIIHAPSESGSELESIWEHLIASVAHRGIRLNKVHFNPQSEILAELVSHRLSIQLILVWGLKSQPRWGDLFRQYCSQLRIDYLVAITQEDLSRFRLFPPQSKQGDILPLTVPSHREKRLAGFFAGFFYGATPYGYKKAPVMTSLPNWMKHKRGTGPQILELGDPYEIEIVQCIFSLFGDDGISRTQILRSLISQHVEPPCGRRRWTLSRISSILSDPIYIGSNRYGDLHCQDVFPSIISKQQFFKAQATLSSDSPTLNFDGDKPLMKDY